MTMIVAQGLGANFVMRNGVFVPMAYRRIDLGGGWVHYMRQSTYMAALHECEKDNDFACAHPGCRERIVMEGQALFVRAMGVANYEPI